MILYTKTTDKIKCTKTKPPRINGRCGWDHIFGKINDVATKFWFTVKNNSSYFYFQFKGEWYKTDIVPMGGMDVWCYIYNVDGGFYTKEYKDSTIFANS